MKVTAKLLPEMQKTKMPLATIHHMGYTLFAIEQKDLTIPEQNFFAMVNRIKPEEQETEFYKVIGKISSNASFVRDLSKVEIETDSTTGFVIFYGNKKHPSGRCSAHNKTEDGEYVKVKCPTCKTFH